jgi:hypothetical protein
LLAHSVVHHILGCVNFSSSVGSLITPSVFSDVYLWWCKSCDFYHLFFGYLKYQYGSPKLENKGNFFDTKYEVMTCIDDIKSKQMIL